MTNEMSVLAIVALAIMGVAAAITAFLRTPRERRYRFVSAPSLEERLKDCPESMQAVIIKGNRRRWLLKSAPHIFIGAVLFAFTFWSKNTTNVQCAHLLGFNAAYIWLLLFSYGLPIGYLAMSLPVLQMGLKTIKTGYFPPLDSVVFRDTMAKKGAISTLRGVVLLVLPVLTLFVVYLGNNAYTSFAEGKSMYEIVEKLEAKCH